MTLSQLSAAMRLAQDCRFAAVDANGAALQDISIFDGFATSNFAAVSCTLQQLAALVRWQCIMLNGAIDGAALQDIRRYGRARFNVLA